MDIGCETVSEMPAFLEFVHFADRDAEFFLKVGDLIARGYQGAPRKRIRLSNLGYPMRIYLLNE